MLKQLTTKSILFIFAIFMLIFFNTQMSWAVRSPDEEHTNRPQSQIQNKSNSASAIVDPATVDIPNKVNMIKKEKRSKHAPEPIIRDLRDLAMLKTVLSGQPKTEDEIGAALINLLKVSPQWLGEVPVKNLRLDYVHIVSSVDGRAQDAYVRFVQQHRGNDIQDSFVAFTLKILPDWTIISSAQAQLYPRLKLRAGAHRARVLTNEIADRESLKSLRLDGKRVHKKHDRRKVRFIDGSWREVREIKYEESDYQSVIDENSDDVWVEDMRVYGTIQGKVEGRGILFDPSATGTNLNTLKLKDLKLSATSGAIAYSDILGNFNFPSETTPTNISAGLVGRWAKVISKKNDDLAFGGAAIPGTALNIVFNPTGISESAIAQVDGYYHTTFIHDWIQSRLAPNPLSALDVSFPINVNINATCNAYYNGIALNFYSSGGGCINSAYDTVVYHEYGHFVDDRIGGITNGGLSEGWGDVLASYATGQPIIGEGFFGTGTSIRRVDNNYQYPASGSDEVHALGQAWAGFAWHLRENLIASLGKTAGITVAENLIIPTFYANSKDIPTALYDVLIRDDNDGDLSNSTPHYMEIVNAANLHSIPLPENDVTSPDPVNDLQVFKQDALSISLKWTATGDDGRIGKATSYDIRYSLDPIQTEAEFDAATPILNPPAPVVSGEVQTLHFNWPAFNVNYYFAMRVLDNMQNASTLSNVVQTQVKAQEIFFEDFETGAAGWTSDGLWHITPNRYNSPTKSFAYNNGTNYDTGTRNTGSLVTPEILIPASANQVIVNFKEWVDTEKLSSYDKRSVEISSDNGAHWSKVFLFSSSIEYQSWITDAAMFNGYAGKTVRFRFLFDTVDASVNNLEGWYVDDIGVYFVQPPILETIGNKTVDAGQTLTFSVAATDPGGQPLTYSAYNLPSGATFANQVFTWTPNLSQIGTFVTELIVSNGNLSDSEIFVITVENPNKPDLIVKEVLLNTPTLPAGTQMSISDKIKNIGLGNAALSTLNISLSLDAVYGGTDDISLLRTHVSALPSGAEVGNSRSIAIPITTPAGNYYVCEKTDSDQIIAESNEANNTLCSATTVAITSGSSPDLIITKMDGPSEYVMGTQVPLKATVKNIGQSTADNVWVAFFISQDPIITPGTDQLVGLQLVNSLAPGIGSEKSVLSSRTYLPAGTYYWGAYADDINSVPESNELNNGFAGNVVVIRALAAPVLNSATAGNGQAYLNWSSVATATSYTVKYGTTPGQYSTSLDAGNVTSYTVPNLAAGTTYYFVVVANSTQGSSSNSNEKSVTLVGHPDLVMTVVSSGFNSNTGSVIVVNDTIKNIGNGNSPSVRIAYYLSTDNTITTSDILLGTRIVPFLNAGASNSHSNVLPIAEDFVLGSYYLGAIADYDNAIDETDESNNTLVGNSVDIRPGADLYMPTLNGPATGIMGKTVTLNDVVDNTGSAFIGSFEIGYYLSTDIALSTSDIFVGSRFVNGLAKNTTDKGTVDIVIPENLTPGVYYWGAIADYKEAQPEKYETNNFILGNTVTIQIPVPAKPVLNSAKAGNAEIALNWTRVNMATGYNVMYGTTSGVYTTLINAGDVTSFTIPNLTNGVTYYVAMVAVNSTGASEASNEMSVTPQDLVEVAKKAIDNFFQALINGQDTTSSKTALDNAIAAILNPTDQTIVFDYYDAAALATAKSAVDDYVQTAIDGLDTTAAQAIFDNVIAEISNPAVKAQAQDYYDASIIKTIKPLLNSVVPDDAKVTLNWDNVANATSYTIKYGTTMGNYSVSIDAGNVSSYTVSGLTNGTMYYFVIVAKNSVGSSMISNEKSATPKVSAPDLIINEVSISSNGKIGSPVVITDTVTNQGSVAASGFYIGYYLSTDSVITSNDKFLNYRYVPTLDGGASNTRSITINIPSTIAPGTYYVGAIVDVFNSLGEADENNNIVTGNTITVELSGTDLVMTAVNSSASGKVGSSITITDTVTNQGTDSASGFYVGYYLSTDSVITTSDKFLYYRYVPSLLAGTSDARSLAVTIPNVAPGAYFLGAIADAFNSQGESNENNNAITGNVITVTVSNIDLVTSALSTPASGKLGSAVTITDTVTNQGTENAGAFYMAYYLSTDPIITTSDRLVYYRYIPSLAAGASNTGSVSYNIPNLVPGTYYWGAIADAFNSQGEVNESNNAKLGNKIVVSSSTVDLVMSALSAPATGKVGSLITLTDTVTNQGDDSAGGFYVAYYLSTDAVITTSDKFLYYRYVPSLAAGASNTGSVKYNIPNIAPGTYYWGAVADAFGSQPEINETNNAIVANTVEISL
ncbi:MAG: fibronectin type III domain-containing protein [Candidatus Omnitrophica bacterium]|nr:fibronectin type III domain-containing protein [Candidatus Omnitrophota bacterium]